MVHLRHTSEDGFDAPAYPGALADQTDPINTQNHCSELNISGGSRQTKDCPSEQQPGSPEKPESRAI